MTINKESVRVLFLTRAYGQAAGGMERLSYELIEEMKQQAAVDVSVIAHTTKQGASLTHVRFESIAFLFLILPRALWDARHADVIHLGDPVLSFIGWCIQKLYRKPVVVTVHGLDVSYPHAMYQWYLRTFFQSFNAYVAISSYAANLLQQFSLTGEVHIIPPGLHDRYYSPAISRVDLDKVIKKNTKNTIVLATVGRLVARKGHAWFISNVLPSLSSEYIYVIAGDGPERNNIEKAATYSNVTDRVILLGRVSDDDLKTIFNTVDVYVQPNISVEGDAEGFGIVLLEAALCERAVVAAQLEGISDAISNGNNGTLLPTNDAPAWINTLKTMNTPNQKNSAARVFTLNQVSWNAIGQKYSNVFTRLVESK